MTRSHNPPTPLPLSSDCGGGVRLYDLRAEQGPAHRKTKRLRGRTVQRDPADVTGVVLHQTAVPYGVSERQVRASGGDAELALARRALGVACHALAFRSGIVAIPHRLTSYVHHGNALNPTTLGLEVDGRYPGLVTDPEGTTWGGEPTELTEQTIETARTALRWLVEQGRAVGMPLEYVYAHRQSSASRRSDPGEGLWGALVWWAEEELGLRPRLSYVVGDGRPVPLEWDPRGVGRY